MSKNNNDDLLFDFYMKFYDDIIAHFMNLDAKIARYFSAYSIFVALTGFISLNFKFVLDVTKLNELIFVNYIIFFLVMLMLFIGWGYLFSALKVGKLQRFAYDESMMEALSENTSDKKRQLSERAMQAIKHNVAAIDKKAKKMEIASRLFFPIMIFFALGLVFAMVNVYEAVQASAEQTQNYNSQSQPLQQKGP